MTSEQFVYWLQGFNEVSGKGPTQEQWTIIQDHLQLVFKKITPTYTPKLGPQFLPSILNDFQVDREKGPYC